MMDNDTKTEEELYIKHYNFITHPEGGYYTETYRGIYSSSIYFLLSRGQVSKLHVLSPPLTETFCYHYGVPTIVHLFIPSGDTSTPKYTYKKVIVGPNIRNNEVFQYTISPNIIFGAEPMLDKNCGFSIIGCHVAPPFSYDSFRLNSKDEMNTINIVDRDNNIAEVIERLT